jgi:hypothetical protein
MFTAMEGKILKNIHVSNSRYIKSLRITCLPTHLCNKDDNAKTFNVNKLESYQRKTIKIHE